MSKKHYTTSIFITDTSIGIYAHNLKKDNKSRFADQPIPEGVIEYGYIKEPFKFLGHMKKVLKKLGFRPNQVNWIVQDQNILIRELTINKSDIQKNDIPTYLEKQVNITLFFPFGEATFAYKVKSETDETITLSVFIADKNLVDDYLDVFDRLNIRNVDFNIISSVINNLYSDKKSNPLENSMVVSVYDNNITINIIENKFTIFGMNDERDLTTQNACTRIEEYIERIANYYQYNLRKGNQKIDNVFVIDMGDNSSNSDRLRKFKDENIISYNLVFLNAGEFNSKLIGAQTTVDIAYISSITVEKEGFTKLEFNISRPNKNTVYMNYIMLFSISLVALLALIYIPFINLNEQIVIQDTFNQALIIQRDMLEDRSQGNNTSSDYEQRYNEIFTYLNLESVKETEYIEDLVSQATSDIEFKNIKFFANEKRIELTISASSEVLLYEYLLTIYEEYGIVDGIDNSNNWIVSYPLSNFSGSLTMEVVIYYA